MQKFVFIVTSWVHGLLVKIIEPLIKFHFTFEIKTVIVFRTYVSLSTQNASHILNRQAIPMKCFD